MAEKKKLPGDKLVKTGGLNDPHYYDLLPPNTDAGQDVAGQQADMPKMTAEKDIEQYNRYPKKGLKPYSLKTNMMGK